MPAPHSFVAKIKVKLVTKKKRKQGRKREREKGALEFRSAPMPHLAETN